MEVSNILISRIANNSAPEVTPIESVEALSTSIEAQSSLVRDLKASKVSSREEVSVEVTKLLRLKALFKEAAGFEYRSSVRRSGRLCFYDVDGT
jgi:argininosuccinate lyase